MNLNNLKLAILQNRNYIGGGVHTYSRYLSKVLSNIPGSEVDLIVPDGYKADNLPGISNTEVISNSTNNKELLNKYDIIFAVTIYDWNKSSSWDKWMQDYDGPIVSTIHSWSDYHPGRYPNRSTKSLKNNKYFIDYEDTWCSNLVNRYDINDECIRLHHYNGYPFIDKIINEEKTKDICCFGRIYDTHTLNACELTCNVFKFDHIDIFGLSYRGDLSKYSKVRIIKESYNPEDILDLIKNYKYALFPDIVRNPDTDGTMDWVILEMLATSTIPIIYHTSARLYESKSNIYVQSFNKHEVINNHTTEEILSHNSERFKDICSLSKATDVMMNNIKLINSTWRSQ